VRLRVKHSRAELIGRIGEVASSYVPTKRVRIGSNMPAVLDKILVDAGGAAEPP
jgi:hypothetical protein